MFQFNYFRKTAILFLTFCIIVFCSAFFSVLNVHAKSIGFYPYNKIYNNLPAEYQSSEYLYVSDNIPLICFATYNGNDYKTSIKRTNNTGTNYLYCVDYSKHVDFSNTYGQNNKLFNNELRARLCIAFYYGPSNWKGKANSQFTTGNTILDYYMTQMVVHSLIYKYGNEQSNSGIDFSKIVFKNNTSTLSRKTKEFYNYCCSATIYKDTSDMFKHNFSFKDIKDSILYLDGSVFSTPYIECNTSINNAPVKKYSRTVSVAGLSIDDIKVIEDSPSYDSTIRVEIPQAAIDKLEPGKHILNISENVVFNRYLAGFYQSTDEEHTSQEIGGIYTVEKKASDTISFSLLIGNVILHKCDSITGANISDADFVLQQYNDLVGQYVDYKRMAYNQTTQQYESGNIYILNSNSKGLFRLMERRPGENYINDWKGEIFQLTEKNCFFEFTAENHPILGELKIHKSGEQFLFSGSALVKKENIKLSGIKFGLYAKEDIFLKNKLLYPKDKKIADLITDEQGEAYVNNLVAGDYYFKEEAADSLYQMDSKIYSFSIKQNDDLQYSKLSYEINNLLKRCNIHIFKFYYDRKDNDKQHKLPLADAKFGLYAKADIIGNDGKCIVKKDTLIAEAVSDKNGMAEFTDLPYADYYIKELEAPANFIQKEDIFFVSKEDFLYNEETNQYDCTKEVLNLEQEFNIQILKYGEMLCGYQRESEENGEYYYYQLKEKPLKNVEFGLYNEKDELVSTAITGEDGIAQYSNLKPGKYYVMEQSGPGEYLMSTDKITFTCEEGKEEYDSEHPPVFQTKVENQLSTCTIKLSKSGEKAYIDKKGIQYHQIPLENVVFGIYQNFDYTFDSGEILPKDSCVGYIVTDKDGNGCFSAKLPSGIYYIKELKTNSGYDIDTNIYTFELKPEGNHDTEVSLNKEYELINQLSKASVQIIKTDANTNKKLKNVEFTLYSDKDEKIGVYKTDRNGTIVVNNLPYGAYYFVETKCRNGYYSSNSKYRFTLESSDIITLNITNMPILKLGFEEHYKIGLLGCLSLIICFIGFLLFNYYKKMFGLKKRKRHLELLEKEFNHDIL